MAKATEAAVAAADGAILTTTADNAGGLVADNLEISLESTDTWANGFQVLLDIIWGKPTLKMYSGELSQKVLQADFAFFAWFGNRVGVQAALEGKPKNMLGIGL